MPAGRALDLGLVNMVVPDAAVLDEAQKLASRVAKMPTSILGRVKRLMNDTFGSTLDRQLESERKEIAASANSLEGREGLYAFLEKRRPDFVAAGKGYAREAFDLV
jgi:2-(1,2-epoxy-1,2-dihydrophenyl)acetyl-CoA isomerase